MDGDFEPTVSRSSHRVVASFFDEVSAAAAPPAAKPAAEPATVTAIAAVEPDSTTAAEKTIKSMIALRHKAKSVTDDDLDALFGPSPIELGILPQPKTLVPRAQPCLTAFLLRLHRNTALNLLELGLQTLAELRALDAQQLARTQLTPGQLQEVLAALAKEQAA